MQEKRPGRHSFRVVHEDPQPTAPGPQSFRVVHEDPEPAKPGPVDVDQEYLRRNRDLFREANRREHPENGRRS